MDIKKWLTETARRPVTDSTIAEILDVTRKTANKRVNEGLTADDLIEVCRSLEINPVIALVELCHITDEEVLDYLDSDGQLVATADPGLLALELARQLNPATLAPEIDELASRRSNTIAPRVVPSDEDVAAAIAEANSGRAVAQKRTEELTEPDSP